MELQDIATAFGLHEIKVDDTLKELQKNMVIAYLTRIKKIPEKQLKEMSFYRYNKIRIDLLHKTILIFYIHLTILFFNNFYFYVFLFLLDLLFL